MFIAFIWHLLCAALNWIVAKPLWDHVKAPALLWLTHMARMSTAVVQGRGTRERIFYQSRWREIPQWTVASEMITGTWGQERERLEMEGGESGWGELKREGNVLPCFWSFSSLCLTPPPTDCHSHRIRIIETIYRCHTLICFTCPRYCLHPLQVSRIFWTLYPPAWTFCLSWAWACLPLCPPGLWSGYALLPVHDHSLAYSLWNYYTS